MHNKGCPAFHVIFPLRSNPRLDILVKGTRVAQTMFYSSPMHVGKNPKEAILALELNDKGADLAIDSSF